MLKGMNFKNVPAPVFILVLKVMPLIYVPRLPQGQESIPHINQDQEVCRGWTSCHYPDFQGRRLGRRKQTSGRTCPLVSRRVDAAEAFDG